MDINNMNDITVLKEELKKRMVSCIKDLEIDDCIFRKGQYYNWYGDNLQIIIYDDNKNYIFEWQMPFELEEYFNMSKCY